MSFEGSDVDGLDRLAQDCTEAAQVVTDVKVVCEAIVAAASIFGPFGAAFIAYLKTVVIPWLTKIAEALQLFAKVLSARSALQRDASSSATSLPSYTTPSNLPAGDTNNYPVLPSTAGSTSGSLAWGLINYTRDKNGDLTDLTLGGTADWGADTAHFHVDYSAPGQIAGVTENSDLRLGSTTDPLVHATADSNGNTTLYVGEPHVTNDANGTVTPVYDASGRLTSVTAQGHDNLSLNGIPLARVSGEYDAQYHYDSAGNVDGLRDDLTGDLTLGPGTPQGSPRTDLPAGVRLAETPSGESTGLTYRPPEAHLQLSSWLGSYGYGAAGSGYAHTEELVGGLGGGGEDGLSGGVTGTLGASAQGQFFLGTLHEQLNGASNDVSGVALGADAWAGYKIDAGATYNGESSGGYVGGGLSPDVGGGASGYLLQRNGTDYLGGSGEIEPFSVNGGLHTPDAPPPKR